MQSASKDSQKSLENPIFIFGSARSGTSLLSRIINSHPQIGVPFESLLYPSLYPWLSYYGDLSIAKNREQLIDDMISIDPVQNWTPVPQREKVLEYYQRHDFHGAVDALMRAWLDTQGKTRWGEKSPWHAYYWREILEGFPEVKIIHIVRDGRDAALSWKQARFGPKHFYPLARRWVHYLDTVDELRQVIDKDRFYELRYEDLLASSESISREICDFLDVEYSPEMLAFYKNSSPYPTDVKNNANLSKPLMAQNAQKWPSKMNERDLRIFEAVAGDALERYGYERGCPNASLSKREVMQIKYIEHPPKRIVAMLKNGPGYIEAARRWKIYTRLLLTRRGQKQSLTPSPSGRGLG